MKRIKNDMNKRINTLFHCFLLYLQIRAALQWPTGPPMFLTSLFFILMGIGFFICKAQYNNDFLSKHLRWSYEHSHVPRGKNAYKKWGVILLIFFGLSFRQAWIEANEVFYNPISYVEITITLLFASLLIYRHNQQHQEETTNGS